MARYIMVETRDPFESRDVHHYYDMATQLAEKGEHVTLFLVQNGVLAARKTAPNNPLTALLGGKVEVFADSFSLRERAINDGERSDGIAVAEIDKLVDLMMADDDTKVMWH